MLAMDAMRARSAFVAREGRAKCAGRSLLHSLVAPALLAVFACLAGCRGGSAAARVDAAGGDGGLFHVLLYSRTAGFRHDSIPDAVAALTALGATNGYVAEATEDPAAFTADNLARF